MQNKNPLYWETEPQKEELKRKTIMRKTNWMKVLIILVVASVLLPLIQKEFIRAAISLIFGAVFIILLNRMTKKPENSVDVIQAKRFYLLIGYIITISAIIFSIFAISWYFLK